MRSEPETGLAVFFTHGISLEIWERNGIFDREVGYHQHLRRELGEILFVTYDLPSEGLTRRLAKLAPITALYNRWRLPYRIFGLLAPFLHAGALKRCRGFKTLQLSGAWTAVIAKWLLRKPLVVRCGYAWSFNLRQQKVNWLLLRLALLLERLAVRAGDVVFTTTRSYGQYLARTHGIPLDKLKIIPNAIDTHLFRILPDRRSEEGVVAFVGRISPEKNIPMLIEACRSIDKARLWVIGTGPEERETRLLAAEAKVDFLGAVPNHQVPTLLNKSQVFVLPSSFEGSPKALLEAMACGLAVIGTNVPGIREVIKHEENGLLCEPQVESLTAALTRLLGDARLRERLGSKARDYVVQHHSLDSVVQWEAAIWRSLFAKENLRTANVT